jgi:hypothetical protein
VVLRAVLAAISCAGRLKFLRFWWKWWQWWRWWQWWQKLVLRMQGLEQRKQDYSGIAFLVVLLVWDLG